MSHYARKFDNRLGFGRERLTIKAFPTNDALHRFLNTQGNEWGVSGYGLKAGTYAMAGGKWHNVRKLDAMTLAHV
jgi:hypothetical protein